MYRANERSFRHMESKQQASLTSSIVERHSNGVYGSWKKGTNADVVTNVKLYDTPAPLLTQALRWTAKSGAPKVLTALVASISTRLTAVDLLRLLVATTQTGTGTLQEPVLYAIMPDGSNLNFCF